MNTSPSAMNLKCVEEWELTNLNSLAEKDQAILYAKAIQAIKAKSLTTLSLVTVLVISDRVLCETKSSFAFLEKVKIDPNGIDFSDILDDRQLAERDKIQALKSLLLNFFDVFGRLTADIITPKLHAELKSTDNNRVLFKLNQITSGPLSSRARNRD